MVNYCFRRADAGCIVTDTIKAKFHYAIKSQTT